MIFSDDFEGDLSAYSTWVDSLGFPSEVSRTVISGDWACSPAHSLKCSIGDPNPARSGRLFKSLITKTPPDGTKYYSGLVLNLPAGFWANQWVAMGGVGGYGIVVPWMWMTASNSFDWGSTGSMNAGCFCYSDTATTGHLIWNATNVKSFSDDNGSVTSCEYAIALYDTPSLLSPGDPSVSRLTQQCWIDGNDFGEHEGAYTTYTDHYAEIGVAIGEGNGNWDSAATGTHYFIDSLKFDSSRIGVQTCGVSTKTGKLAYYKSGAWHVIEDL